MPLPFLKFWGVGYCKSCINHKYSEGNKLSMDLSSTHIFVKVTIFYTPPCSISEILTFEGTEPGF